MYCEAIFQTKKHSVYKSIRLVVSHAKKVKKEYTNYIDNEKGEQRIQFIDLMFVGYYLFGFIVL